ncbi:hypothetical protein GQ457_06G015370 [Hibiscus cannabinus]
MPVRAALVRSLGLWRLPHPGVRCQGGSLGNLIRTRPPGCIFLCPWACGLRLGMLPLLGPSVLGESRSQGCAAKAPCAVCLCAAKAPRARWRVVCAVLGGSRNLGCAANPYAALAPCARPLPWLAISGPSVASLCRSLVFKL